MEGQRWLPLEANPEVSAARGRGRGTAAGGRARWEAGATPHARARVSKPSSVSFQVTNQVSALPVTPDPGVRSAFPASLPAGLHLCIPLKDSGISSREPPVCGCARLRPFQATTWLLEMRVQLSPSLRRTPSHQSCLGSWGLRFGCLPPAIPVPLPSSFVSLLLRVPSRSLSWSLLGD